MAAKGEPNTTTNQVPRFNSIEEEAEFWDTHSPLDYPDYWKQAKVVKAQRPLAHILAVRLDAKVVGELSAIAERKGIGPSTLARIWLMERLEDERQEQAR
jgi:hypothetical protein